MGRTLLLFLALIACGEDGPGLVDPRCVPTGDAPQTIDETLARINTLPEPSLRCLVASLPRPLRMTATRSVFSAQPAAGIDRPRVFLHTDGLVLSLALGGDGANLLEFGEWVSDTHTIKGEIAFPLEVPVRASAPFEHLERGNGRIGTTCGICHSPEESIPERAGAFASPAFRPRIRDQVNVEYLRALVDRCDADAEPHGCTLLHALFDYGDVIYEDFAPEVATF